MSAWIFSWLLFKVLPFPFIPSAGNLPGACRETVFDFVLLTHNYPSISALGCHLWLPFGALCGVCSSASAGLLPDHTSSLSCHCLSLIGGGHSQYHRITELFRLHHTANLFMHYTESSLAPGSAAWCKLSIFSERIYRWGLTSLLSSGTFIPG